MENLETGIKSFDKAEYSEAYSILLPLAEAGDPRAQCYIASMYQGGFGLAADGQKAVYWYLKAANQRERKQCISGVAYNNLGTIYHNGAPGINPDPNLAKKYWKKALELGFKMIPDEWID